MKKFFMVLTGLLLVTASVFSAEAKSTPELSVSMKPDKLTLEEFGGGGPGDYIFKNNSKVKIEFNERNAVFVSSDGKWTSQNIGPFPTKIEIEPGMTHTFNDNILVPYEVVLALYQEGKLKSGDFTFIQHFDYTYGEKEGTVSVKWDVKMTVSPEKMGIIITNTPFFTVVTKKVYFPSDYSQKNLKKFLVFADSAATEMEKLTGIKPSGNKLSIRIGNYDGMSFYAFPFLYGGQYQQPYMFLPADLIAYPCEWINLSFAQNLAKSYLYGEFGTPPMWMFALTQYLADKTCAVLGYSQIAQDAAFEMNEMGTKYIQKGKNYLFIEKWMPENYNDNPGDYPLAFGRAYQLIAEIEKLCGADIFAKLFAGWKKEGFKFAKEMPSPAKTAIVIDALAKVSGKDVLGLFKKYGYQPE